MINLYRKLPRAGGFSLVELMVSIVIGLLAILFATRIMTDNERNKDAALGSADSMQNGMLAMFSMSLDAEQAGFGLNDPLLLGCNTLFNDSQGYRLAPATRAGVTIAPLAPLVIENNPTGSDRITMYAGSAPGGTAVLRLSANYLNGGNALTVDRVPYGFNLGDVLVVAPETPGDNCALSQVGQDPAGDAAPPAIQQLRIGGNGQRFNNGGAGLGQAYTGNTARVFNLGPGNRLAFRSWSVQSGYLRLQSTDMAGAANASQAVADNIVLLKAQYGFDTRPAIEFDSATDARIGRWSSTMIDADGAGGAGSAGDFGRVVAVRLALVARSKNPQRPPVNGDCTATTQAPTLFGSTQPSGVTAVPVTLGLTVAGDTVDWRCYNYRVFETIISLRNAGWRP